MGDGYGPIIVRKRRIGPAVAGVDRRNQETTVFRRPVRFNASTADEAIRESLRNSVIAVPGKMTSAFLALQLFLGEFDYLVVPFDQIFEAVKNGRADAGLIIHEGQLTYARSGFQKVIDLGEWWKNETGLPLPLGGNVLRKDIPPRVQRDLLEIIRDSIDFGLAYRNEPLGHWMPYARVMDADLTGKFIGMS